MSRNEDIRLRLPLEAERKAKERLRGAKPLPFSVCHCSRPGARGGSQGHGPARPLPGERPRPRGPRYLDSLQRLRTPGDPSTRHPSAGWSPSWREGAGEEEAAGAPGEAPQPPTGAAPCCGCAVPAPSARPSGGPAPGCSCALGVGSSPVPGGSAGLRLQGPRRGAGASPGGRRVATAGSGSGPPGGDVASKRRCGQVRRSAGRARKVPSPAALPAKRRTRRQPPAQPLPQGAGSPGAPPEGPAPPGSTSSPGAPPPPPSPESPAPHTCGHSGRASGALPCALTPVVPAVTGFRLLACLFAPGNCLFASSV
eukprot:XP_013974143.1 basic proline-rich protein-like [Canis lupus familiaris]